MLNQTYSETKGEAPFNWFEFLKDRREGKPIDDAEIAEARIKAESWVTCACGNQCARIERTDCGVPFDNELYNYGQKFYLAIENEDWDWALTLLMKIEKRVSDLMAEEGVFDELPS